MSGEGYRGHVFWDTEVFLLPFYIYTQPETAKALVLYRYNFDNDPRKDMSKLTVAGISHLRRLLSAFQTQGLPLVVGGSK